MHIDNTYSSKGNIDKCLSIEMFSSENRPRYRSKSNNTYNITTRCATKKLFKNMNTIPENSHSKK